KPLIDDLRSVVNELCANRSISLTFELDPRVQTVEADPIRLKQILLNLINNAVKFNRDGGEVYVRLYNSENEACVVFEIEDTGIGIPEGKLPNLFSEFYQVDDSLSRENEGTGLGLALTKRLVELHGGSILVKSTEGVGSTFIFKLPP